MGNEESKIEKGAFIDFKIDYGSCDQFDKAEYDMPFYTMSCLCYESRLKKFIYDKDKITDH